MLTQQNIDLIANEDAAPNTLKAMRNLVDEESDDMETDDEHEWNGDDDDDDVQKKNSKKGNDFLDQFWSQLPSEKTSEDVLLANPISFDYLFETSSNNFIKNAKNNEICIDMEIYEYVGSLSMICIVFIFCVFMYYVFFK